VEFHGAFQNVVVQVTSEQRRRDVSNIVTA
jgi:hypothetical protein